MRLPVFFVGHGSPMNAIQPNDWSPRWAAMQQLAPAPKAILCVSAHWFGPGLFVTAGARPKTIHDFGGFPQELYEVQYPAPGSDWLTARVAELTSAAPSKEWGLDHGAWSVLLHMFPKADVPVVQLSLDARLPPEEHARVGALLAPLRDEGVLIVGSGNVTHNLRYAFTHRDTPAWAQRFDADVARAAAEPGAGSRLAALLQTADGRLSHPTPDHYLPLVYAASAADGHAGAQFPVEGFDLGSLSMRCIVWT